MSKTRRMVAGSLRCRYKQLQILPDRKTIRSDDYSTATVTQYSAGVKQAVLDDSTYRWDSDSKDWYIRFESDGYDVEYLITEIVSATSLKFSDAAGTAPTGSVKWEVVGYPKDQRFSLNRIIYTYEMMDDHGGYYVKEREPKGNDDE